MDDGPRIRAGKLLVFSEGEYSDYGYRGAFVGLENVTHEQIQGVAAKVRSEWSYTDGVTLCSAFEAEMIRRGWLLAIDMNEIHLGDYGVDIP